MSINRQSFYNWKIGQIVGKASVFFMLAFGFMLSSNASTSGDKYIYHTDTLKEDHNGSIVIMNNDVHLYLNGHSVTGYGYQVGILAEYKTGVRIIGPGTISNFNTGIYILGGADNRVYSLNSKIACSGISHGVRFEFVNGGGGGNINAYGENYSSFLFLHCANIDMHSCDASGNAMSGIWNESSNGSYFYDISAFSNDIDGITVVSSRDVQLHYCTTTVNGHATGRDGVGFYYSSTNGIIRNCISNYNARYGFFKDAGSTINSYKNNSAVGNGSGIKNW